MAQEKSLEIYTGLPTWARGVVVISGIGIAFYIGYTLIQRIKDQAKEKKIRESVVTQENELKDRLTTGQRLSYAESQYQSWATEIANEFAGCDPFETSFSKFMNIIYKLKNDVDFLKLSTSFNVKTYDQCGIWIPDFKGNLHEAVNDEFDNNQIIKINKALANQKITYYF